MVVYKDLEVHFIESKVEACEKDKFKRKVSKAMIKRISDKFQGGVFQYRMNESVEFVIQQIVEWDKSKRDKLFESYITGSEQDEVLTPNFEKEQNNPTCTCRVF